MQPANENERMHRDQINEDLRNQTPNSPSDAKWMSEKELSALTGLSIKTLQNYRSAKKLFPFSNPAGTNINVYERAEIYRILELSRVQVRP